MFFTGVNVILKKSFARGKYAALEDALLNYCIMNFATSYVQESTELTAYCAHYARRFLERARARDKILRRFRRFQIIPS